MFIKTNTNEKDIDYFYSIMKLRIFWKHKILNIKKSNIFKYQLKIELIKLIKKL